MDNRQRIILTRLVTGSLLFFLVLRAFEHTAISGLNGAPLFRVEMDFTYWLYKWSGLPSLIVQNRIGAVIFDGLLFLSGLISFLFPLKKIGLLPFSIFLFVYVLSFNMYVTHHMGQVYGFMVVLLPFLISDNYKFTLAWEGMRYFTCFIYFMAFVWKTCINNSFYYLQQGANSFKYNLVDYISLNPDTAMTAFYKWFLRHEWALNAGEKVIILLEGIMFIGLLTKKFDRLLIWVPVAIHVITYFFSDVFFIELLVVDLSFLKVSQLDRIGKIFGRYGERGKIKKVISLR
jgi:hypothetical protein